MEYRITGKKGPDIPKEFIGLFIEDINYAIDGGLYAEMLENRNFECVDAYGCKEQGYYTKPDGLYAWSVYPEGADVRLEIVNGSPVAIQNPHYLRITTKNEGGFFNKAYDGLYLKAGVCCHISFYARSVQYKGELRILAVKAGEILLKKSICVRDADSDGWQRWEKYETDWTPTQDIDGAVFVVMLNHGGIMEFDHFSLMPEDAVLGIFRKDLVEALKELHPGFLRFPGGCVVEGALLSNRYRYQDTLVPKENRRFNWNRWAVSQTSEENDYHSRFSHYGQTYGVGFYEFFLLCEYLEAKPLPILGVGLACQFQSCERIEPEDEQIWLYIQEYLDLIEFANGGTDTKWGSLRAQMGHPDPFGLQMIGVGNEQWETEYSRFFERYAMFEREIHRVYPDIKLVGTAGPEIESQRFEKAWKYYYENVRQKNFVYLVDEHCYTKPEWFLEHVDYFDQTKRDIPIFFGEYAAHPSMEGQAEPTQKNTLQGALAEAAFLIGMEKNSDLVRMTSYAPLLARIGYEQWSPNLLWFDAKRVCRTPSYYVQQIFAQNPGDYNICVEAASMPCLAGYDCTKRELVIKLVNATSTTQKVEIILDDVWETTGTEMTTLTLSGETPDTYNTLEEERVGLVRGKVHLEKGGFSIRPYSFVVLRIPAVTVHDLDMDQ